MDSYLKQKNCAGKNIIIMAGGTGGHVFPALAVARCFKHRGANISWLGTKQGIEAKLIPAEFDIDYIKVSGIRKKSLLRKLTFPLHLINAIFQAKKILKACKADIVIGFGGYASGPGGVAAYLSNKPLIIHEQNAIPGMTNKYLSKIAKLTLLAFPYSKLKGNIKLVGNPVRDTIKALNKKPKIYNKTQFNLLILGGSLGAKALNDIIPKAIEKLTVKHELKILHQCGENLHAETLDNYANATIDHISYEVKKFIDNMAAAYEWADIIVCRSGASTVSEIAVVGLPAIFIPYPHAVDDHQYYNAKFLVDAQAAISIRQSDLSLNKLVATLDELLTNPAKLSRMSQNAHSVAITNAADLVVDEALKYLL